jgi:tripartite-type tricarboxylate transporter receptor subunit TctC
MGLWVSPDVPADAQARLRDAALKVMGTPEARAQLKETGFDPGQPRSTDEMQRGLRTDYARVGALLKSIDFKPE